MYKPIKLITESILTKSIYFRFWQQFLVVKYNFWVSKPKKAQIWTIWFKINQKEQNLQSYNY